MKPAAKKIWFPAKRYGWGWGPPCCWQGWVFLVFWLAATYTGAYFCQPDLHLIRFLCWMAFSVAVLIVVCCLKGEKPGWRWGGK